MKYLVVREIILFIFSFLIGCSSVNCYAQGKVTRPVKTQTQTSKPKKAAANVKVSEPDGYINGHGYVDLGLPSGTKWATCNVGANNPEAYGGYFAWGETAPKSGYYSNICFDRLEGGSEKWGEYKVGGKTQISPSSGHDAAHENWGFTWRMPTHSENEELVKKCSWVWTTKNGHKGYVVTGPNGKSIFLPAAGYRSGTESHLLESDGEYWSSSLYSGSSDNAQTLYFHRYYFGTRHPVRSTGYSVRPVSN